jgi:ATP-binding cassette, subfamily C (CFTR/MRP), member 1
MDTKVYGFALAFLILILAMLQAICRNQYEFMAMRNAIRIQSALTMMVFNKAKRLSNKGRSSNPPGTIINYILVDVEQLKNLPAYGHLFWSTLLQIVLSLNSLYQLIGASAFIGFETLIGIIPLDTFVSKFVPPSAVKAFSNGQR